MAAMSPGHEASVVKVKMHAHISLSLTQKLCVLEATTNVALKKRGGWLLLLCTLVKFEMDPFELAHCEMCWMLVFHHCATG